MTNRVELEREIQSIPIKSLKVHPRQKEFFSETSEAELDELALDLSRRGQQEPIHVCPDFTTLCGHRRVMAATKLGWESILAIVRHDLANPNSPDAIMDLIGDNVFRRQLDELELARCYRELKASYADDGTPGDLRDHLAVRLKTGKSGRSLDRLERLLQLPRDIQDMISGGLLNKHQAEKILRVPQRERESLFEAIRRGDPVAVVLQTHGIVRPAKSKSVAELGEDLLRFYQLNLKSLARNIRELDRLQLRGADVVCLLNDATKFMMKLRDRKQLLKKQALESLTSKVERR